MNLDDKQESFLSQLNEHRKILYKLAFVYCRRSEDRKDLIQEMLIQLWRSYEKSITARFGKLAILNRIVDSLSGRDMQASVSFLSRLEEFEHASSHRRT